MSFTLFVILPNKDVCSLRHLASGTSIRTVRKNLEMAAGLPAQTYRLTSSPEGHVLHEDHVLRMDVNVWDGYVIRAVFLDSWQELYDHIVPNHVDHVIKRGAVHMRSGDVMWKDAEEEGRAREVMRERGEVALFVASCLGMVDMCRALLTVGVNPNGRSQFRRTPLMAAMSRDHHAVMELLLSHNARLESRDADGVTAVDWARRAEATQCMRRVRHLHLHRQGEQAAAVTSTGSSDPGRRRALRVIRIPTGSEHRDSSCACGEKPGWSHHDDSPHHHHHHRPVMTNDGQRGACVEEGAVPPGASSPPHHPNPPAHKQQWRGVPQPRTLFRQDRDSELYTWDINSSGSRAPSATTSTTTAAAGGGTTQQVRQFLASSSEGQLQPRARGESPGTKGGGAWSDSRSVGSSVRMLPFRPSVQQLSIRGPSSVLTTSTSPASVSTLSQVTVCSLQQDVRTVVTRTRRPSALVRFLAQSPHSPHAAPNTSQHGQPAQPHSQHPKPHVPAREPPGRPPTRAESGLTHTASLGDLPAAGDALDSTGSVLGSQETLSVDSAPVELTTTREGGGGDGGADHGELDDDRGRMMTSHAAESRRFSDGKFRTRLLVSRQKQQESWKTVKRRIKLLEEQKRHSTVLRQQRGFGKPTTTTTTTTDGGGKESFEDWLERKRREPHSGTDDDTDSEDDEDAMNRSAENSQVVNEWLKDLKRQEQRPQTSSPVRRQKTRPSKSLAEVGGPEDMTDSRVGGYRQWQHRKKQSLTTGPQGALLNTEKARLQLEEKRKSLLAMALTFQNWTEHAEQRKKLMQAILRADMDKLEAIEQHLLQSQPAAPRQQISFNEWREKVDKKEAEIRHQRQRMRKEAELRQRNGVVGDEFMRNTRVANVQEEWLQRNRDKAVKERSRTKLSVDAKDGDTGTMSEDEKENALEEWFHQKHRQDMAQLNRHLRQERQLLLSVRQKKQPTVTQC